MPAPRDGERGSWMWTTEGRAGWDVSRGSMAIDDRVAAVGERGKLSFSSWLLSFDVFDDKGVVCSVCKGSGVEVVMLMLFRAVVAAEEAGAGTGVVGRRFFDMTAASFKLIDGDAKSN